MQLQNFPKAQEHTQRAEEFGSEYAAQWSDIAALQVHGQHVFVTACLSAIARVGLADHVNGERGFDEIAAIGQVHPLVLRRVVRFLEPHGFFEVVDGRVSLTTKGRLLRSDGPIRSALVLRGANDALLPATRCAARTTRLPVI